MAALTQRSFIAATTAATLVVVVLGYFVYDRLRPPCDTIFEQTTTRVEAKLSIIKSANADVLIGREKVQDLSKSAQKLALNLKACCIACGGNLNVADFLRCKAGRDQQEGRLERLAEILRAAQLATEQAKPEIVSQQVVAAGTLVEEVRAGAAAQEKQVAQLTANPPGSDTPVSGSGSDILHPKIIKFATTISGEISAGHKEDWFRFTADTPVRDWVDVMIENRSTTLQPCIALYDSNRSGIASNTCASNASANVKQVFLALPRTDYLVQLSAQFGTAGAYALSTTARKAYDAYEPNNDAFSAKPIAAGKPIEANIMDGAEADWFLIKGFAGKQLTARADNRSTTLQPCIALYDSNRSGIANTCASNAGANVQLTRPVESGKDYYIVVSSQYGTAGNYRLAVDQTNQ